MNDLEEEDYQIHNASILNTLLQKAPPDYHFTSHQQPHMTFQHVDLSHQQHEDTLLQSTLNLLSPADCQET